MAMTDVLYYRGVAGGISVVEIHPVDTVEHCYGGRRPSVVDFLDEIDKWVETGDAPDQVVAYWLDENMQPSGSRPVCAYPNAAQYDGKGDTRNASSFSCAGGGQRKSVDQ